MPVLFCFGLGYTASALARRVAADGWRAAGTYRAGERAAALRADGIEAHVFDGAAAMADARAALRGATHILLSVPPDEAGDPVLRHHADDLAACAGTARWLGYLSTIGVYGDRQGAWIDEATPPDPLTEDSRRRLAAERAWLAFGRRTGIAVHVFRLSGLYGPGRSQFDALRAGRAHRIVKPGQVFNRIHVDDLAAVLAASMRRPDAGCIYNVADDEPASAEDVVVHAAALLGVAPPAPVPFAAAGLPPFAAAFYAECKRVRNGRIRDGLGVRLACPSYREGLAAVLAAGG